jgi:signal transduction histidine kinase
MLSTLRRRLILSHVLPLLITIPLMGIALIYVIETQVLLGNLSRELTSQALLTAQTARDQPAIWTDPALAGAFITRMDPYLNNARLMLFDTQGEALASSDPADQSRLGQKPPLADLPVLLAGQSSVHVNPSSRLDAQVVDVTAPVLDANGRVVGIVELSHPVMSIYQQFLRLRYLIGAVLGIGLLLGGAVGWALAVELERPLQTVTRAVDELVTGGSLAPLPEQGPVEIRMLLHAVNTFVERVQTLEGARRQLLANLVHELGRPLGSIRSAIQALQGGAADDLVLRQELLAGMDAEVGGLRRLVDDLAHLHDQVVGDLELARRPTPLSDWLSRLLPTYRQAALAKGLAWQAQVPADLPITNVDPDRLGQAVGNLLSNAIKYTSAGGQVGVAAERQDHSVWIRVDDSGPGIAPEEQQLIFTPFYRSTRVRRFPQGMGLGLTIARDLTAAHGGHLQVESEPGKGSRFTLWLPLSN